MGGQATNEEGFLVQHLLRQGLGSQSVFSGPTPTKPPSADTAPPDPGELGSLARALARVDLSARVSDIDHADAILVLDTELVDEAPILDLRVRKAVRRNGARLVVASSRPSTLDGAASAALRFAPGASEAALAALAAALGSSRADSASLDDLARSARAEQGFIPGRRVPRTNGVPRPPPPTPFAASRDVFATPGDVVVIWGERVVCSDRALQAGQALLAVARRARHRRQGRVRPDRHPARHERARPARGRLRARSRPGARRHRLPEWGRRPAPSSCSETDAAAADMESAAAVIAFSSFRSEALDEHADVVFPAEVYAEKEGTITHPDGRIQRVRQALGRAADARPGWSVLAELCERLGAGTGALSAPMVTALVAEAVPFYAGITLDEIGGDGVRWQDRERRERDAGGRAAQRARSRHRPPPPPTASCSPAPPRSGRGPRSSTRRRSASSTRARARWLSVEDARRLGIENGGEVELAANGDSVTATAVIRTGVPAGSVFLSPALASPRARSRSAPLRR